MANASMVFFLGSFLVFQVSCASPSTTYFRFGLGEMTAQTIETALRGNPVAPDQNIRVTNLGQTATASHHLIQIRDREELHIHRDHDLTVFIYRGHGTMLVGTDQYRVRAGDVLFIEKGVPHAFRNDSMMIAAAIAVFSPCFDGRDTIPVGK